MGAVQVVGSVFAKDKRIGELDRKGVAKTVVSRQVHAVCAGGQTAEDTDKEGPRHRLFPLETVREGMASRVDPHGPLDASRLRGKGSLSSWRALEKKEANGTDKRVRALRKSAFVLNGWT
jgi:hypothetical protein